MLRIRYPYLLAIEEGRFSELPGKTYATGFVRTYAEHLGLDADEVVRRFKEESSGIEGAGDLHFPSPVPESTFPTGAVLGIGLIVAGLAYGGWHLNSAKESSVADLIAPLPDRLMAMLPGSQGGTAEIPPPIPMPPDATQLQTAAASTQPATVSEPATTSEPAPRQATVPAAEPAPEPTVITATPAEAPSPVPTTPPTPPRVQAEAPATPPPAPTAEAAPPAPTPAPTPAPAPTPQVAETPPPKPQPAPEVVREVPAPTVVAAVSTTRPAAPAAEPAAMIDTPTPPVPAVSEPATAESETEAEAEAATEVAAVPPPPDNLSPAITTQAAPPLAPEALVPPAPPQTDDSATQQFGGGGKFRILVRARSDSWIQVRDETGNELIVTRLLRAGDSYRVPNRDDLTLQTGNAGALEILVDGEIVPSIGPEGAVRRRVALNAQQLRDGTAVVE